MGDTQHCDGECTIDKYAYCMCVCRPDRPCRVDRLDALSPSTKQGEFIRFTVRPPRPPRQSRGKTVARRWPKTDVTADDADARGRCSPRNMRARVRARRICIYMIILWNHCCFACAARAQFRWCVCVMSTYQRVSCIYMYMSEWCTIWYQEIYVSYKVWRLLTHFV